MMIRCFHWEILIFLAFLFAHASGQYLQRPAECSSVNVSDCQVQETPIDLLYLLDTSNSINRTQFYGEILGFLKLLNCALNDSLPSQTGVITFSHLVNVVVPLAHYSINEWFNTIDQLSQNPNLCCQCCTPLAEAFDMANQLFLSNGVNKARLVIVITDGGKTFYFLRNRKILIIGNRSETKRQVQLSKCSKAILLSNIYYFYICISYCSAIGE